ncbi:MAG: hypothetical protein KOO69_08185 [Victivallales bacterium]|nr:hypothetical protein [Victivallales bacterium]
MDFKTLLELKGYHSEKLGDLSRKLNYSGIAVIWIFSKTTDKFMLSGLLWWALFFCVMSLLTEMLQYGYSYIIYDRFYMRVEREIDNGTKTTDTDLRWDSPWPLRIMHLLFYAKPILAVLGFLLLISYIIFFSK